MQDIWLRKCSSFEEEEEADREFWAQMTGNERVQVLEQMRRDAWKVTGERPQGIRKVARILQEAQGPGTRRRLIRTVLPR
ncbi:MAG TPA: hypothetical protein DD490_13410 [Acidobacteria bacterium]|nr:hypothetical protein [Acidobacteriota bacterium]